MPHDHMAIQERREEAAREAWADAAPIPADAQETEETLP